MKLEARWIVVAALLFFAWRGADLSMYWPHPPATTLQTPRPDAESIKLAAPLAAILPKMLPHDRQYLAAMYDAMAFVLARDGERESPIIATTEQLVDFHASSLRLTVDKANIGKYPGLAEAIDQTFVNACGADPQKVDAKLRSRAVAACAALAWTLVVGTDE
jgi:hypothetical protein